jgi:beta-alanine degradation protein BauB
MQAIPTIQQDDEVVRITRWDFAPGAATGWHEHAWPYFVTMIVAGTLRINDGHSEKEVALGAGQAYMRPAGIQHDVANASAHAIAFVEIEVKRPQLLTVKQAS